MTIDLIRSGLQKGFHLESEDNHLKVVRDRKICCSSGKVKQLEKEREGVSTALKIFKAAPTSTETVSLYTSVNQRYKCIRSLTSGFFGWLISLLFRSRQHNHQLKLLQKEYLEFREAFSKKELIESIAAKVLIPNDSKSEAQIFKQLQKDIPDLFKQHKIRKKDFKNAPFFIQKEAFGYQIIIPAKAIKIDSLADLKWLALEMHPFDDDSKLKNLSETIGIDVMRNQNGGLLIKLKNPCPAIGRTLSLLKKHSIKISLTLNDHCSRVDLDDFYKIHGQSVVELTLEEFKESNTAGQKDLTHWITPIAHSLQTLTIKPCNPGGAPFYLDLTLRNLKKLQKFEISDSNISRLWLYDCPSLNNLSISNLQRLQIPGCCVLKEISMVNCDPGVLRTIFDGTEKLQLEKFKISNIGNLAKINLSQHQNLKEISVTSRKLEELNLSGLNLVQLSLRTPSLRTLRLAGCQFTSNCLDSLAAQISQWEAMCDLNFSNCQLTNEEFATLAPALSTLPNIRTVDVSGNAVTQVPEILTSRPALHHYIEQCLTRVSDFQIAKGRGHICFVHLSRDVVNNSILELIDLLSSKLSENVSDLFIKYVGEMGVDVGGLSRDFIGELFTVIAKKCLLEGVVSLDKTLCSFKTEEDAEKLFHGIGKILSFVLRTSGRYPIGNVFSLELFESLKNCSATLIDKSYNQLSVQELLSLSGESFNKSFAWTDVSEFLSASTKEEALKYMTKVRAFYTKIGKQMPDQSHLKNLQDRTQQLLFKHCKDRLWPIHAIAKGFSTMAPIWNVRSKLRPEFIEQIIQGFSSKEHMLQNLRYSSDFPPNSRQWLEEWIKQASRPKLTSFIQFVAGAKALSHGQHIFIQAVPGRALGAHSCGLQLDLPIGSTRETLWAALDDLDNGVLKFNLL